MVLMNRLNEKFARGLSKNSPGGSAGVYYVQ